MTPITHPAPRLLTGLMLKWHPFTRISLASQTRNRYGNHRLKNAIPLCATRRPRPPTTVNEPVTFNAAPICLAAPRRTPCHACHPTALPARPPASPPGHRQRGLTTDPHRHRFAAQGLTKNMGTPAAPPRQAGQRSRSPAGPSRADTAPALGRGAAASPRHDSPSGARPDRRAGQAADARAPNRSSRSARSLPHVAEIGPGGWDRAGRVPGPWGCWPPGRRPVREASRRPP